MAYTDSKYKLQRLSDHLHERFCKGDHVIEGFTTCAYDYNGLDEGLLSMKLHDRACWADEAMLCVDAWEGLL